MWDKNLLGANAHLVYFNPFTSFVESMRDPLLGYPINYNVYLYLTIFLIFGNILTYFLLGIQILISNILMLSFYALLVPSLFFTYGSYIEKETTKNQVERLIQSLRTKCDRKARSQSQAMLLKLEDHKSK